MKLMLRRMLLVASVAALTFTANSQMPTAAAKELKLAHFMPPQHVLHREVFEPLQKELEKISGGDLTIRIYPAGALGKGPDQQYMRAVQGVADIVFGIPQYTGTIFPRTLLLQLPGVADSAEEVAEKALALYDKHLAVEYDAVKVLGVFSNSPTTMILRNREVRTPEDLRGLKVRLPNPAVGPLIQRWGGAAVSMPVSEAYNAMNTGVVDAVWVAPSALYRPWNLIETAKYVVDGIPGVTSMFYLVMNKDSWNALTPEQQAAIEKVTGREMSLRAARAFGEEDRAAMARAREDDNIQVIELTEEERQKFQDSVQPFIEKTLDDLEADGIPAREIFADLKRPAS